MNAMPNHAIHRQSGAALIVSLILLLVMTLLGVSAMQTNVLEEKMAGNFRDRDLAFQAAEAALRDGETYALTDLEGFNAGCEAGLCFETDNVWELVDWSGAITPGQYIQYGDVTGGTDLTLVQADPKFVVEELAHNNPTPGNSMVVGFSANPSDEQYYRITARAVGGTTNAVIILQSVFRR